MKKKLYIQPVVQTIRVEKIMTVVTSEKGNVEPSDPDQPAKPIVDGDDDDTKGAKPSLPGNIWGNIWEE